MSGEHYETVVSLVEKWGLAEVILMSTHMFLWRIKSNCPVIIIKYPAYLFLCIWQRFLISIPGGVFTEEGEEDLLKVLTIGHKMEQYDAIHE